MQLKTVIVHRLLHRHIVISTACHVRTTIDPNTTITVLGASHFLVNFRNHFQLVIGESLVHRLEYRRVTHGLVIRIKRGMVNIVIPVVEVDRFRGGLVPMRHLSKQGLPLPGVSTMHPVVSSANLGRALTPGLVHFHVHVPDPCRLPMLQAVVLQSECLVNHSRNLHRKFFNIVCRPNLRMGTLQRNHKSSRRSHYRPALQQLSRRSSQRSQTLLPHVPGSLRCLRQFLLSRLSRKVDLSTRQEVLWC
jgi:hypothetical protein